MIRCLFGTALLRSTGSLMLICSLFACQTPYSQTEEQGTAENIEISTEGEAVPTYRDIDLSIFEQKRLSNDPNTIILDVRTPPEVAAGQVPGAINIDFRAADFTDQLSKLDPSKTYLVYCRSGARSTGACELMQELNFSSLYNLIGGYTAWAAAQ